MQNVCVRSGPYMYIPKWLPIYIRSGVFQPYAVAHSNHIQCSDGLDHSKHIFKIRFIPNHTFMNWYIPTNRLWFRSFQPFIYRVLFIICLWGCSSRSYVYGEAYSNHVLIWFIYLHLSRLMTKPTKWLCAQRTLRSTWASAQSDQSLRCALNG